MKSDLSVMRSCWRWAMVWVIWVNRTVGRSWVVPWTAAQIKLFQWVVVSVLLVVGCCPPLLLTVVWESSTSASRQELSAVDVEVNQGRLSKYYPFLWAIISPQIYDSARRLLKTQFQMVRLLWLCAEAQTVALGHDGSGGDGSNGSTVYKA